MIPWNTARAKSAKATLHLSGSELVFPLKGNVLIFHKSFREESYKNLRHERFNNIQQMIHET